MSIERIVSPSSLLLTAARTSQRQLFCRLAAAGIFLTQACANDESDTKGKTSDDNAAVEQSLHALVGPEGGELVGLPDTAFAGVRLTIPAGSLQNPTQIEIRPMADQAPLPAGSVACGPLYQLSPSGLTLAKAATLTLPFSASAVNDNNRFEDEVKVWWLGAEGWGQREQTDSQDGAVTVEIQALTGGGAGVVPPDEKDLVHIEFAPNAKFLPCLAQYPDDPTRLPTVQADVVRGDLNDGLFLHGKNIKPGLQFDLFTVEHSSLLSTGAPDPAFKNFGFAWYQSDLEANDRGSMHTCIHTILLDQIFGFDAETGLAPTNTFELGFWFNDPNAAAACGFDVSKPTPFNGEHKAGPLAMITRPDATTGLGPLCTKPDTSVSPARCDP